MENLPENSTSSETPEAPVDKTVKLKPGLRLELRGEGNYYKGILHIGSTLIPISDEILEELRSKTALPADEIFPTLCGKGWLLFLLTRTNPPRSQKRGRSQRPNVCHPAQPNPQLIIIVFK